MRWLELFAEAFEPFIELFIHLACNLLDRQGSWLGKLSAILASFAAFGIGVALTLIFLGVHRTHMAALAGLFVGSMVFAVSSMGCAVLDRNT